VHAQEVPVTAEAVLVIAAPAILQVLRDREEELQAGRLGSGSTGPSAAAGIAHPRTCLHTHMHACMRAHNEPIMP